MDMPEKIYAFKRSIYDACCSSGSTYIWDDANPHELIQAKYLHAEKLRRKLHQKLVSCASLSGTEIAEIINEVLGDE